MTTARQAILCILLAVLPWGIPAAHAFPPLENGILFPAGTFVIPMDEKQTERVVVWGFIEALLSSPVKIQVFRVIEPPDLTLSTSLTTSPRPFTGGPFLVYSSAAQNLNQLKNRPEFAKITIGTLTSQQTLNNILRITEPAQILVVKGLWGGSDAILDAMMIPYNVTTPEILAANPNVIFDYSLVVIDSFGWYGLIPPQVADNLRNHVNAGNEVIFTDIALKDLNATFPSYVTLWGPQLNNTLADSYVYSPPKRYGSSGGLFSPEPPSQYYNPSPHANEIRLYAENAGYVVSSVPSAGINDVRIIVDSNSLGSLGIQYGVLAFYFPYGRGLVEGLAFNPQKQTEDLVWANGHYAVFQLYGNMLIQSDNVAVDKYNLTTSLVGLPEDRTTTLQVDGVKMGDMNGNEVQVLSYPVGTSHTIQVDQYVSGSSGYRYYCVSNIRTVSSAGSIVFNYVTQVHLSVEATPSGVGSVSLVPNSQDRWYNVGTSVQATANSITSTYTFANWVLDGSIIKTQTLAIDMNLPHALTADFAVVTTTSSASTTTSTIQTTSSSTSSTTSSLSTQKTSSVETVNSSGTTLTTETYSSPTSTENPSTTLMFWGDPAPFSLAVVLVGSSIAAFVVLAFRVRRIRASRRALRICPDCGFGNPPYTRAFCVKCGGSLERPKG